MKEGIGGTQLVIIVITLILLFASIMAFTINHAKAFAVKDEIVAVIEKYGGFDMSEEIIPGRVMANDSVIAEIAEILVAHSYRQTGTCPDASGSSSMEVEGYQRDGQKVTGNRDAAFCIVRITADAESGATTGYYYQVVVFYNLDIPVIKDLSTFRMVGETKILYA